MTTSAAEATTRDLARRVLDRAVAHLRALQHPEGFWWGELESNSSIAAEQVFLLHLFGVGSPADRAGLREELIATQGPDGGWANWFDGPADLSTTVEAYYALRLLGVSADAPELARARDLVLAGGGANRTRFFTKLWLAVMGRFPYEALPTVPPEVFLLPPRLPAAPIYRLACWARGTFVPITVVLSRRPVYAQPVGIDELFLEPPGAVDGPGPRAPGPWTARFRRLDGLLQRFDRHPVGPLRRLAERRIARWIIEHQEADGSWGGIQPPWVYSLIALHTLGYPLDHPVMRRGIEGFESFTVRDGPRTRIQACMSPVWDTALAAVALADAGAAPGDPALERAARWLVRNEISRLGDWHVLARRGRPGGWAFEFANEWYPDTDDTAEVLLALRRSGMPADAGPVRRGVQWLLAMQCANGGWGAFDVENHPQAFGQHPVCDFGEIFDPPTEDVTAHVVEALVACGLESGHPAIRDGVAYLWRTQRPDGSWWGRWGVNHVYGTGAAVPALLAAGVPATDPRIMRAVDWLGDHQNGDGGWGERVESYRDPALVGRGPSTASQTAWALLAIVAARPDHPAIAPAVGFLARTQRSDGSWDEPYFTGTGFPMDFMINYHLYRLYFPVTALGRICA